MYTNNGLAGRGGRISYIDAMRGFSMILVVFGHVLLMMGFPTDSTVLGAVLMTFRMPLFFFVSGFFAYRALEKWTKKLSAAILKRKIQAQIISTLFFYTIFQLCHSNNPLIFLSEGFSWFWFTIVLFQMFIAYMTLALLEHITRKTIFVLPGLIIFSIISFIIYVKDPFIGGNVGKVLSWYYLMEYFQFFSLGILSRKFYPIFEKYLRSNIFRTITILAYIVCLFIAYGFNRHLLEVNNILYKLVETVFVRYFGLFVIFILFFQIEIILT